MAHMPVWRRSKIVGLAGGQFGSPLEVEICHLEPVRKFTSSRNPISKE